METKRNWKSRERYIQWQLSRGFSSTPDPGMKCVPAQRLQSLEGGGGSPIAMGWHDGRIRMGD